MTLFQSLARLRRGLLFLIPWIGPILVPAQPVLDVRLSVLDAEIRFQAMANTTNQVQWIGSLGQTNWLTLSNVVASSNHLASVWHPGARTNAQRFYRVLGKGWPLPNPHPDELVWIPPGTFLMGSPSNELNRSTREGPQTRVTLSKGYWMAKHEVAQWEFGAVLGYYPSHYLGFYLPVDTVTWHEATNYCVQRTAQERTAGTIPEGYAYRLPTEAEWEYAARAGTTNRFSFGDDPTYELLPDYAWFGDSFGQPNHHIQQKLPNSWGLYDMHGNVFEWCLDWYASSLPGGSLTDPKGPVSGLRRVLRSGSGQSLARDCRSAARDYSEPEVAFENAGFRIVLAPVP